MYWSTEPYIVTLDCACAAQAATARPAAMPQFLAFMFFSVLGMKRPSGACTKFQRQGAVRKPRLAGVARQSNGLFDWRTLSGFPRKTENNRGGGGWEVVRWSSA